MTAPDSYYVVLLKGVVAEEEDLVTYLCFEYGAQGVAEDLAFQQVGGYDPQIVETDAKTLSVFFSEVPVEDFFLKLQAAYPNLSFERRQEENKDWLAEWKKSYHPFQLAGPYWVVPTWLEKPDKAERAIWIDPGMAFGTGTHATTQMVAELLFEQTVKLPQGFSLLDVGTGTGILAFLARMQGASRVVGTEIDPEARRVVRENIAINKLTEIEIPEFQVQGIDEKFDVVTANIIESVLLQLKPSILKCLKPNSKLILSGILHENEVEFLKNFLNESGLRVTKKLHRDEWLAVLVE